MEWIAAAIALVAAGAAFWQAHEARKARVDAQSSSEAAAQNAKRMADALEEQVKLAKAVAEKYDNPWSYSRDHVKSGNKWTFRLGGDEPAHEVSWDAEPVEPTFGAIGELPTEMIPGEAVQFSWLRTMGSAPAIKLTVSWRRPGETELRTSRTTLTG